MLQSGWSGVLVRCTSAGPAGVRSLSFLDQQLSCGTGYGRVSFYDLRAAAWMDLDPEPDTPPPRGAGARRPRGYQQLGPGWLCQTDSVYMCAPPSCPTG